MLTLTVAEHEALDDEGTTLEAAYRIKDSADNIMAEIQTQATGSSTVAGGDQAGYDEDLSLAGGNEMEESRDHARRRVCDPGATRQIPAHTVTVDAFHPADGMLFPSVEGSYYQTSENYDTGLGVQVESTGEWVGTDDDSSGSMVACLTSPGHIY